jgi:four helix bundle protein
MNTYQFSFEKLEVWQLARQLAGSIYKKTQSFPSEEKYSLVSQLRRSAVSVCANIAEGTTRATARDQAHFTTIAFSSLMEVFNHLIISSDLGYINENELADYRQKIQPLTVKLTNLKASQVKRISKLGFFWLMFAAPQLIKPLVPLQLLNNI